MYCRKVIMYKDNYEITYKSPPDCDRIVPQTRIQLIDRVQMFYEDNGKYVVFKKGSQYYVYKKEVIDEVLFYADYFKKMKTFMNPGLLFIGPPGTGKTTLATLIPSVLGIDYIEFDISSVLGMYVGETEKNMKKVLESAILNKPKVVVMDEADSVLMSREKLLSQVSTSTAELNAKSILLQYMLKTEGKVLFIAITNLGKEWVDSALIRPGRFGRPVYIPPPDKEAIKIYIKYAYPQIPSDEADKLATMLVSASASFATVVDIVQRYLIDKTKDYHKLLIEQTKGYTRLITEVPYDDEKLKRFFADIEPDIYCVQTNHKDLAIPLLAAFFANQGKSHVILYNEAAMNEALKLAEVSNSVLIVDPTAVDTKKLYRNTTVPVIVVSHNCEGDNSIPITEFGMKEQKVILSAYNIKYEPEVQLYINDLERIVKFCKGTGTEAINCVKRVT